jgi:hypothetical protein
MSGQPRPTALSIPDLPDGPPRDFNEVMKQQEQAMKAMFTFEQWAWITWLEVRGYGKRKASI